MDTVSTFAAIGIIVIIGFLGQLMFQRTKVPDILILIFIGFAFGPVARQLGYVFVSPDALQTIAPYFAAMALMIILFDGGLNLNFDKVLSSFTISTFHSLFGFVLSSLTVSLIAYFLPFSNPLHGDMTLCLMLGTIVGGTSSAIVLPLLSRLDTSEETKALLTLESVLTDVLCIVMVIVLIEIRSGQDDLLNWETTKSALGDIAATFSVALVVGAIVGVVFLKILRRLQGTPYSFMITIAALLILYAFVEYVGGSGPVSALMFGLVLSNKDEIARMLKIKTEFVFEESVKQFHSELSFFIRTFFFVYLGLVFAEGIFFDDGTFRWKVALALMMMATSVLSGIMISRFFLAEMTGFINKAHFFKDRAIIWTMMPRGLAAAVLASLPFQAGVVTAAEGDYMLIVAFLLILLTCTTTTIGVSIIERKKAKLRKPGASSLAK